MYTGWGWTSKRMTKSLVPSSATLVSSRGLPAAVGEAGELQLGGVRDELVHPRGQARRERQIDVARGRR